MKKCLMYFLPVFINYLFYWLYLACLIKVFAFKRWSQSYYMLTLIFLEWSPLLKSKSRSRSIRGKKQPQPWIQTQPQPIQLEEARCGMSLHLPSTSNHANLFDYKILQRLSSLQSCSCQSFLLLIVFGPKSGPYFVMIKVMIFWSRKAYVCVWWIKTCNYPESNLIEGCFV